MGWISKFLETGDDKVQVIRVKQEMLNEVKETIKADLEDICEHFESEIDGIKNALESLATRVRMLETEQSCNREARIHERREIKEITGPSIDKQISNLEDAMGKFIQTSHSILFGEMQQVKQHVHNACAQLSYIINEEDKKKSMP